MKNYCECEKCDTTLYQQVGMGYKGMVKLTFPFVDLPPCVAYSPHEYTTSIQSRHDLLPENWLSGSFRAWVLMHQAACRIR
jgi:hypothetical protein